MKLLRAVLYAEAVLLAAGGIALVLFPAALTHRVFHQPELAEYAWVRLAGIHAVGWAMLYVLVAHRIEQVWWWCWAFVLVGAAIGLLSGLNALFGAAEGSSPALWWLLAGVAALFSAGLIAGLGKTGLERAAE